MTSSLIARRLEAETREIAARVRALRRGRGWNVGELAGRAAVSRTTLYHLERGTTLNPRGSTLSRVADALEVSVKELLPLGSTHDCGTTAGIPADAPRFQPFDRRTNPVVSEVCSEVPSLFSAWSDDEWDELYSTFGTGGALNRDGVIDAAKRINGKRDTVRRLHVVLETHLGEVAARMIDTLYRMVQPESNLAATSQLAELLAWHRDEQEGCDMEHDSPSAGSGKVPSS